MSLHCSTLPCQPPEVASVAPFELAFELESEDASPAASALAVEVLLLSLDVLLVRYCKIEDSDRQSDHAV